MFENEIHELAELNKKLAEINKVLEACIRITGSNNPDPEDYKILTDFTQKQHGEEWVDEEWDEAMATLPQRMLIMLKPRR